MTVADDVTKVHAICVRCGSPAYVSHRLVAGEKQVLLGETDKYEPICRQCFNSLSENEL
jgi:thymidine kinase